MSEDILLVTSWDVPCGIAEHSAFVKEAVESQADDLCFILQHEGARPSEPEAVIARFETEWKAGTGPKILHLNYHAALHSRWMPEWIPVFQKRHGVKVVITFHDTGVPNSVLCRTLHDAADAFIVHEPCEDLPRAYYQRMGVPALDSLLPEPIISSRGKAYDAQPVLGSIGFPFGWKHYGELARITAEIGWALYLIAPTATDEQVQA